MRAGGCTWNMWDNGSDVRFTIRQILELFSSGRIARVNLADDTDLMPMWDVLAWAYVRDEAFVAHVRRYDRLWPMDEALRDFNESHRTKIEPRFPSVQFAWEVMLEKMIEHGIKTEGILDSPDRANLLLTKFSHRWPQIFCRAKDSDPLSSHSGRPAQTHTSKRHKLIDAAKRELWPNGGWESLELKDVTQQINDWLKKYHPGWNKRTKDAVSSTTVWRYLNSKPQWKFDEF